MKKLILFLISLLLLCNINIFATETHVIDEVDCLTSTELSTLEEKASEDSTIKIAGNILLIDLADLLTESQKERLNETLSALSTKHNYDIVVLTVDSLDNKSAQAYADDFYDYNGYKDDGIILLVSMEERDYAISTKGKAINTFTDKGLEYICDEFLPYLSDGDYYKAFDVFAKECDDFINQPNTGASYDVNNMPKEKFDLSFALIVSFFVGILVSLVTCLILNGQLKSVNKKYQANDYVKEGSFNLVKVRDIYLYHTIHKRRKPEPQKSSDGGRGGSSVHISSSGSSHGGRSGKF